MNQNPQNENNDKELDSLLAEFQNLSTPVENLNPNPEGNVGVTPVTPVQPMNPVEVKPEPVIVQPMNPVEVKPEPLATSNNNFNNAETPLINPNINVKLNDLGSNVPPVTPTPIQPETPVTNNNGKGNLIFMIVIFLIMAVFIFFIPKISDLIQNKPGLEAKPTPTPTATATPKPVVKEVKTDCTVEDVVNGDVTAKTNYTYQSLGGKVTKTKKTITTKFANIEGENLDVYNQTKLTCNSLATTYAGVVGYTVTCEEKDNTFTVTYAYDLNSFTNPTNITINGQQEVIKSDVNLNDDIKTVKANMTSVGATCK